MEFETERAAAAKKKAARATVNAAALPVLQKLPFRICLSNAECVRLLERIGMDKRMIESEEQNDTKEIH